MSVSPASRPGPRDRSGTAWLREHPVAVDSVAAILLWAFTVVVQSGSPAPGAPDTWLKLTVASLQTLPLAWRRTRPTATFTVVSLACLATVPLIDAVHLSAIGFLVALHAVSAYGTRTWVRRAALGVGLLAAYVAGFAWGDRDPVAAVFSGSFLAMAAVVAWMWGNRIRDRRLLLAGLAAQNDALRRERDQRARLAARDERTRIAREMHDVVAHSLAVIVVQADGAAYAARHGSAWEREQAALALETIAHTARDALTDTRALVGVLREDPGEGDDPPGRPPEPVDQAGPAAYVPMATLADIPVLVERLAAAGHGIDLDLAEGTGDGLPRDLGPAVHRLVQEALTNVLKHAGPHARAAVRIVRTDTHLLVTVEDDGIGTGAADDGHGHGLIGMRERVHAHGGTLEAGPRAAGGFRVHAALPLPTEGTS